MPESLAVIRQRVVHLVAGQRRELDEWRTAVQQQGNTLARQQLAALMEALPAAGGIIPNFLLEPPEFLDQVEHGAAVGRVFLRRRIQ